MKKTILFTAIFLLSIHLTSQTPFYTVTNMKYQGGISSPKSHPNGGYMALGWSNSGSMGTQTVLVRYNDSGDTLWTKSYVRYGSLLNRGPLDFALASDNSGFFLLLREFHPGYGNRVCNAVMKVDLNGDSIWNKQISDLHEWSNANLITIKSTSDSGFIVGGRNSANSAPVFKKYSSTCVLEWQNTTSTDQYTHSVATGPNQTYFVAGYASGWRPTGSNDSRLNVRKVDARGVTIWEKSFNSGHTGTGDRIRSDSYDVVAMNDGGCITCGRISNPGTESGPALVMRLDLNGDTLWTRKFLNAQTAYKIEPIQDGNFLVYMDRGGTDARGNLVKINANGETLWTQYGYDYWMQMTGIASDGGIIFSGSYDWSGFFIKASPDGTYAAPALHIPWNGETNVKTPANFQWDINGARQNSPYFQLQISTDENFTTIVKNHDKIESTKIEITNLNSFTKYYWRVRAVGPGGGQSLWSSVRNFTTGEIVGFIPVNRDKGLAVSQNFPNPASNKTSLTITFDRYEKTELNIYDLTGRSVFSEYPSLIPGSQKIELDVQDLNEGLYFYEIKTTEGNLTKTMLIAR